MKHLFIPFIVLLILLTGGVLPAQSNIIDLGIFKNPADHSKLEIRLRPTRDVVNGAYSGGIFTVRFPTSYGVTLSAVPGTAQYGYSFAGPVGQVDGYDYYRYQFAGSVNTVNWQKDKEYPLLTLQVNGALPQKPVFQLVTQTPWTRENNADYYQELNGAEMQRTFYVVKLKVTAFNAVPLPNRTVQLDWEYEADASLSHSEIEYSTDGRTFGQIGQAPAHNETDRTSPSYTFLHTQPQSGINYYRIRMVDINGVVEYSSVRAIDFDDLDADFNVFPNPTSGPLTLVSRNLEKYKMGVQYQVVDNNAKLVMTGKVGADNVQFDVSQLAAGVYYVKVQSDQEQLAKFKVTVAHN